MVSVLDLDKITFVTCIAANHRSRLRAEPVILMLYLSKRCQFSCPTALRPLEGKAFRRKRRPIGRLNSQGCLTIKSHRPGGAWPAEDGRRTTPIGGTNGICGACRTKGAQGKLRSARPMEPVEPVAPKVRKENSDRRNQWNWWSLSGSNR